MNGTDFIICKADHEQRNYVLKHYTIKEDKERLNAIIYVATDKGNEIIGRIIVKERVVPEPIGGKYWYIENLFVHPKHRRKGVATALVDEIKKKAYLSDIVYLYGSANASVEASMFWFNQGFSMHAYGKKETDEDKPLLFGNYNHLFSYCIRRKVLLGDNPSVRIRTASEDEIPQLISKYSTDERINTFLLDKIESLFGFVAIGDENVIKGVILASPDSMKAPLDCTRWWIFLYVDPQFRHHGIGRSLVSGLYCRAKEERTVQLTNFSAAGDDIGFWYELGFDIFYFDADPTTGKRPVVAMIRVN
ncbi:MAG: GNAT family N-acetyltransferase [Clostridia bacterium]|nr:GNAT family N-acetyltransferase [Clostridia bacterium]